MLYRADFLSDGEQQTLQRALEALNYSEVRMHGQAAKRQVRHFGYLYGYESWSLEPTDSIPYELAWLRERCATFADELPEKLDEVLVSRYPPGAGIGWHRDAPMFGAKVVGVSLVSEARMRFQRRLSGVRYTFDITLAPGSAYILQDEARWAWQHSIPPVKSLRYSITFRTVKEPSRWIG